MVELYREEVEDYMENKSVLIYQLMRVLTPSELNELTTTSKGRNLVSLTKLLTGDMEEEKLALEAKILPFKKEEKKEPEEGKGQLLALNIECGEKCKMILDDHVKRITVLSKNYSRNCPVVQETSTFIISEKERFKRNYSKSKSAEILSLYKEGASLDIEREKSKGDESSDSSPLMGILVNKKQA